MIVYVNNSQFELHAGASIADTLMAAGLVAGQGTALAVNMEVVPREGWQRYELKEGDRIMVIKATQGG